jgi:tetratricopeptide (TPR) repeat protein
MTIEVSGCLDENALLALVEGRLTDEETARVDAHIDQCAPCRQLVAHAAKGQVREEELAPATPSPLLHLGERSASLPAGATVGRFVVLGLAGGGGMGLVYAAYDPELDRKVALKFLRPSASSAAEEQGLSARLLREAQAMARLSHPNVLAVYDVGTYDDQVFVAMEYVEGQTLARWLRDRERPWREVLDRFRRAGEGLAAAHAAGIVHRDFKPDNVLVGRDGRVRVTDFGLARTTGGVETGAAGAGAASSAPTDTPLTQAGSLLGTPAYMAPEQLLGQPSDARTDLFSFCVSLYEALYRQRPFAGDTLEALRQAVLRGQVREPPRNASVPVWLRRMLLRGLRGSPEERYPSMTALLEALGRDPRRRWRRVAIAASLGILLGIGAWLYRGLLEERSLVCRGAERKLAGIWDPERRQAVESAFRATGAPFAASAWTAVERAFDGYAQGWVAMHTEACEATRIRGERSEELLELELGCLGQRLQELGALSRVLAKADAKVVEKAPQAIGSLPDVRGCADAETLRRQWLLPQDPAARARVTELRAWVAEAQALLAAGRYRQGLEIAKRLAAAAREAGHEPLEVETLALLGELQYETGDLRGAEESLARAYWQGLGVRADEAAARAAVSLVWVAGRKLGKHTEGHRWGKDAGAVLRRLGGNPRLESRRLTFLGTVLRREGRFEEARLHHEQSRAILEAAFGPRALELVSSFNNLAVVWLDQSKYQEAARLLEQSLSLAEEVLGSWHPTVAHILSNLGHVLNLLGRTRESLALRERALALRERLFGPEHPDVAKALTNLAGTLTAVGRYEEGRAHHERALRILEGKLGPEHPDVATVLYYLGALLFELDRPEQSLRRHARALTIREKRLGPKSHAVAWSLVALAQAQTVLGQSREAEAALQRALSIFQAAHGPEHHGVGAVHLWSAELRRRQGRHQEAEAQYRRAREIYESTLGGSSRFLGPALEGQAESLLALGDPDRALALLEQAALLRERLGNPRDLARARFALARALWNGNRDRRRARELGLRAREALAALRDLGGADLRRVEAWLAGK